MFLRADSYEEASSKNMSKYFFYLALMKSIPYVYAKMLTNIYVVKDIIYLSSMPSPFSIKSIISFNPFSSVIKLIVNLSYLALKFIDILHSLAAMSSKLTLLLSSPLPGILLWIALNSFWVLFAASFRFLHTSVWVYKAISMSNSP